MFLKLSHTILLSLAAPKIVAGGASADTDERSLQASMPCLANNGTFASCCPTQGVDPNDGMCTLLSCLDGLLIRDGCSCRDIEEACDQLALFVTAFEAPPGMCDTVGKCCADDGITTITNVDWDICMLEAQEAGNFTLPFLAAFVPGGPPVSDDDGANTNAAAESSSKYAANTALTLALIGSSLTFLFV
jgi:hypothetical protein